MPVEIKELVIRAIVDGEPEPESGSAEEGVPVGATDRNAIVEACVKQVLHILRRSGER